MNRRLGATIALVCLTVLAAACSRESVEPVKGSTTGFKIELIYPGGRVAAAEQVAFETAAARWARVVVGDLPSVAVQSSQVEQSCGAGYYYEGTIDDVILFGDVRSLDGPGGVVGIAGACLLRWNDMPAAGVVIIDRDDIAQLSTSNQLEAVVSHELGHVLDMNHNGWLRRELLYHDRPGCYESTTVNFTGAIARSEFAQLGGTGAVPVEDNGVMGTACSHWDEETFRTELMTGYLDEDSRLSRVTAAALADMGYGVDLAAADQYTLPAPGMVWPLGTGTPVRERILPARARIQEDGTLAPLAPVEPMELELRLGSYDAGEAP